MSKIVVAACMLLASVAIRAQASAPPVPPVPVVPPVPLVPPVPPSFPLLTEFAAGDDMMMFVSSELGGRSVIKGAPYAATAVNETRQVLNDGNRIERSSTIKLYRDGQGRTRQEQPGGTVFINDVVAGKRYLLNTQRRNARELRVVVPPVPPVPPVAPVGATRQPPQPPTPHSQMSADEARSWAEDMRRWAREFTERMRGERDERSGERTAERRVIVTRNSTGAEPPRVVTDHVEVIHMHDGRAPMPPLPPMAMLPPSGPGATTSLGGRDFDGVRADGKKTTWTVPAGQIGNKLPIEIVSERWHAPDLNLVVFSRHADPRSGERIYRLENIKREEPSAELFKVPADFELKPPPAPHGAERR